MTGAAWGPNRHEGWQRVARADTRYYALAETVFGGVAHMGDHVMLRSIVVPEAARGRGLGGLLLCALLATAKAGGARDAWLLTATAEPFFARHGFSRVARSAAPDVVAQSAQFRSLCPQSAALMVFRL
jgi:N-acetylglutamate synthase-like GNAT family acetyltransferase